MSKNQPKRHTFVNYNVQMPDGNYIPMLQSNPKGIDKSLNQDIPARYDVVLIQNDTEPLANSDKHESKLPEDTE